MARVGPETGAARAPIELFAAATRQRLMNSRWRSTAGDTATVAGQFSHEAAAARWLPRGVSVGRQHFIKEEVAIISARSFCVHFKME